MSQHVAVIGLGAMGLPMAETLTRVGFTVSGYDADEARCAAFAGSFETLDGALRPLNEGDAVILSLPNDAVVRTVAACLRTRGVVVIDTSTIAPETAVAVQAELSGRGIGYLDAPVSGGAAGAADGALLMMVGGSDKDAATADPVLTALARRVVRCGGPGTGATVKLANNLLCAGHLLLAGEALRVADAGGVDPETLLDALNTGSGRSAVSEVNLPRWVLSETFDSGFTLGLMAKDVGLAKDLPGAGPLAADVARKWREAADRLGPGEDFNRIVTDPKGNT